MPPASISPLQRRLLALATIVIALTRLLAVSKTLWDWDEAQFGLALREYDVAHYHPHPPGFPVYVALAKAMSLFTPSEFRAYQIVVVLGAMSLFPLAFFLAHELRFPFRTSFLGALLFVFLPNVWFYGGTAFSDVPGTALILLACGLLLRGCRDVRAYVAGAVVLALAAGIRPQSLAFGCAPALLASWFQLRHSWRRVVAGALTGLVVLVAVYAGAAFASRSVDDYLTTWTLLREYVRKVDSFLNPNRAPLPGIAKEILVRSTRGGRICYAVTTLWLIGAVAGIVRRERSVVMLALTFFPFVLFAWLMLDPFSIGRYAVGWVFVFALFAAAGAAVVARPFGSAAVAFECLIIVAIAARFAWWTLPALNTVRTTSSPPVAALRWAARHGERLFADRNLGPQTAYLLGDERVNYVDGPKELPIEPRTPRDLYLTEGLLPIEGAMRFVRRRDRLWDIARRRYFEATVAPAGSIPLFGEGWYEAEVEENAIWVWMRKRSVTLLPPAAMPMRLSVHCSLVRPPAMIEISLNGQLVDRFRATGDVRKSWAVSPRSDGRNELVIASDVSLREEGGDRDLALQVYSIGWQPAATR